MSSDAVLSQAWCQIDPNLHGYIPSRELPLLIDSINTYLSTPLINDDEMITLKKFVKRDPYKRVYKSEFKTLFNSMMGFSLTSAVQDKVIDSMIDSSVVTDKKKKEFKPNFKWDKLQELKENEIRYRDDVINSMETKSERDKRRIDELSNGLKNQTRYEEEIAFRDEIIVKKDEAIREKDLMIKRLKDEIHGLKDQLKGTENSEAWGRQEQFQVELWQRIQRQQEVIGELKMKLTSKSQMKPMKQEKVSIKQTPSNKIMNTQIFNPFALISYKLLLMLVLILIILFYKNEPWYINTPFEPFFFEIIDNAEIDYDYYSKSAV
jgi:hypothetical protein